MSIIGVLSVCCAAGSVARAVHLGCRRTRRFVTDGASDVPSRMMDCQRGGE